MSGPKKRTPGGNRASQQTKKNRRSDLSAACYCRQTRTPCLDVPRLAATLVRDLRAEGIRVSAFEHMWFKLAEALPSPGIWP